MCRRHVLVPLVAMVTLALGALAPAAYAGVLDGTSSTVDNTVNSGTNTVGGATGGATDTVGNTVGGTTGGTTGSVGGATGGATNTVGNTVGGTTGSVTDSVGNTVDNTVGGVTDTVNNTTGGTTGGVTDSVGGAVGGAVDTVTGTTGGVTGSGGSTVDGAGKAVRDLTDSITNGGGTPVHDPLGGHDLGEISVPGATDGTSGAGFSTDGTIHGRAATADLTPADPHATVGQMVDGFVGAPTYVHTGQAISSVTTAAHSEGSFWGAAGRALTEAARKLAFPLLLLVIVGAFVVGHGRFGRKDPKLALAPVDTEQDAFVFE